MIGERYKIYIKEDPAAPGWWRATVVRYIFWVFAEWRVTYCSNSYETCIRSVFELLKAPKGAPNTDA